MGEDPSHSIVCQLVAQRVCGPKEKTLSCVFFFLRGPPLTIERVPCFVTLPCHDCISQSLGPVLVVMIDLLFFGNWSNDL